MNAHLVHYYIYPAVPILFLGVAYVGQFRWWTPRRLRSDADKWAGQRLVVKDERWMTSIESQLKANFRADLVWVYFGTTVLMQMPVSHKAYAACLAAVPATLMILRALTSRPMLPPGKRVARVRELTLNDYLPERSRRFMWMTGAAGGAACVAAGVTREQWPVALSGLLLFVPPASVELVGMRLARMPEPADSAAHLYLQDAFRSDLVRLAALRSALGASFLCGLVSLFLLTDSSGPVPVVLLVIAVLLYVRLLSEASDIGKRPAAYMRARLWPTLAPGQVVMPDDPVQSQEVVA